MDIHNLPHNQFKCCDYSDVEHSTMQGKLDYVERPLMKNYFNQLTATGQFWGGWTKELKAEW